MKAGKTLVELATEIERRRKAKHDFVAPASKLQMAVGRENGRIELRLDDATMPRRFPINNLAHEQIADYAGVPYAYYRKMLAEAPTLLASNVNRWLEDRAKTGDRRMIRVLDNQVCAALSSKYRSLENEDLAEAILPVLQARELDILSCEITDSRLYIKAVDKRIHKDVPTGAFMGDGGHTIFDTIAPAISVSNSEVGRGSLMIETGVYTKACTNMALFGACMRKFHTGARAELSDDGDALLTDATKRATDQAVWMQTRDLVEAAFDQVRFEALAGQLASAADDRIPKKADVVEVIERVGRRFGLGDGEKKGVLAQLIEGGNLTRYGVHAAVTRFSADVEDYDRATELERVGAKVIELPQGEWAAMAKAA